MSFIAPTVVFSADVSEVTAAFKAAGYRTFTITGAESSLQVESAINGIIQLTSRLDAVVCFLDGADPAAYFESQRYAVMLATTAKPELGNQHGAVVFVSPNPLVGQVIKFVAEQVAPEGVIANAIKTADPTTPPALAAIQTWVQPVKVGFQTGQTTTV